MSAGVPSSFSLIHDLKSTRADRTLGAISIARWGSPVSSSNRYLKGSEVSEVATPVSVRAQLNH